MHTKYMALVLAVFIVSMVGCSGNLGSAMAACQDVSARPAPGNWDVSGAFGGGTHSHYVPLDAARIVLPDVNAEVQSNVATYNARARDLVRLNDNRNAILRYIEETPGSTLSDIARSLGINFGTARYHVMILDVNHLVTAYTDGERRVRYFINTGSYREEQMKIIALLKRDPTARLLGALLARPGLTSAGISQASGLPYSDVNRYLKELVAKGITLKESDGPSKNRYSIAPGFEGYVKSLITGTSSS